MFPSFQRPDEFSMLGEPPPPPARARPLRDWARSHHFPSLSIISLPSLSFSRSPSLSLFFSFSLSFSPSLPFSPSLSPSLSRFLCRSIFSLSLSCHSNFLLSFCFFSLFLSVFPALSRARSLSSPSLSFCSLSHTISSLFLSLAPGLGDIVLPGILVAHNLRYDRFTHEHACLENSAVSRGRPSRYFVTTLVGYTVGLFVAILCSEKYHTAQPALICETPPLLPPPPTWAYFDILIF